MKNTRLFLLTITLLFICITVNSQSKISQQIIGSWQYNSAEVELKIGGNDFHKHVEFIEEMLKHDNNTFKFNLNGELIVDNKEIFTYSIDENNMLEINYEEEDISVKFHVSVKNNTLTLIGDKQLVWHVIKVNEGDIDIYDETPLSSIVERDDVNAGLIIKFLKSK